MKYLNNLYPPPILPGLEWDKSEFTTKNNPAILSFTPEPAAKDPFLLKMCECCSFTSQWQMPIVEAVTNDKVLAYEIMGYSRISHPNHFKYGTHFYCQDAKILPSLRSAMGVFERIKHQPFLIGPDYSIKMNMPFPQKLANSFFIKLVTAWYQYMNMTTIANVVWADEAHLEAYLEGYPKRSIIAINSTGVGRDARAIHNWQAGYRYVIEILNPIAIIRYGVKLDGEIESISYYKQNDNFKSCNYGW